MWRTFQSFIEPSHNLNVLHQYKVTSRTFTLLYYFIFLKCLTFYIDLPFWHLQIIYKSFVNLQMYKLWLHAKNAFRNLHSSNHIGWRGFPGNILNVWLWLWIWCISIWWNYFRQWLFAYNQAKNCKVTIKSRDLLVLKCSGHIWKKLCSLYCSQVWLHFKSSYEWNQSFIHNAYHQKLKLVIWNRTHALKGYQM